MKITIERNTTGYTMGANLFVNGEEVRKIANRETTTLTVNEEEVVIQVKGTFVGSNRLKLKGGAEKAFVVKMDMNPLAQILNVAFLASVVLAVILQTKPIEWTAGVIVIVYWLYAFLRNYRLRIVEKQDSD